MFETVGKVIYDNRKYIFPLVKSTAVGMAVGTSKSVIEMIAPDSTAESYKMVEVDKETGKARLVKCSVMSEITAGDEEFYAGKKKKKKSSKHKALKKVMATPVMRVAAKGVCAVAGTVAAVNTDESLKKWETAAKNRYYPEPEKKGWFNRNK